MTEEKPKLACKLILKQIKDIFDLSLRSKYVLEQRIFLN